MVVKTQYLVQYSDPVQHPQKNQFIHLWQPVPNDVNSD